MNLLKWLQGKRPEKKLPELVKKRPIVSIPTYQPQRRSAYVEPDDSGSLITGIIIGAGLSDNSEPTGYDISKVDDTPTFSGFGGGDSGGGGSSGSWDSSGSNDSSGSSYDGGSSSSYDGGSSSYDSGSSSSDY